MSPCYCSLRSAPLSSGKQQNVQNREAPRGSLPVFAWPAVRPDPRPFRRLRSQKTSVFCFFDPVPSCSCLLRKGAAGRPGAAGGVEGVAAQVVDPGAVAVARRQVDPVRRGADRLQVSASWASCSFTRRRLSLVRPGRSAAASGRTGGMDWT